MTHTFAVSLTIPDNEAFTAYETLARLGLPVARVTRAEIWQLDGDPPREDLQRTVASIEAIYNPNKHRLVARDANGPAPGEVWIAPRDEAPAARVAGRAIPGVRDVRRRVAWRLLDDAGRDLASGYLDRAVEMFLCNPAFQVALRA
jgi:hypothetical protein